MDPLREILHRLAIFKNSVNPVIFKPVRQLPFWLGIDPPEARAAGVGEPRPELEAKQLERRHYAEASWSVWTGRSSAPAADLRRREARELVELISGHSLRAGYATSAAAQHAGLTHPEPHALGPGGRRPPARIPIRIIDC